MIPEIRKASQHFTSDSIQFGTIDCTIHSNLCSYEGIRAYPTTRLYNGSQMHHFHGVPNEQGIVEFVENMLHPIGEWFLFLFYLSKTEVPRKGHVSKVTNFESCISDVYFIILAVAKN